jgi:hypothetical protein
MMPNGANWTANATTVRISRPTTANQHDQSTRPMIDVRNPPGRRLEPRGSGMASPSGYAQLNHCGAGTRP